MLNSAHNRNCCAEPTGLAALRTKGEFVPESQLHDLGRGRRTKGNMQRSAPIQRRLQEAGQTPIERHRMNLDLAGKTALVTAGKRRHWTRCCASACADAGVRGGDQRAARWLRCKWWPRRLPVRGWTAGDRGRRCRRQRRPGPNRCRRPRSIGWPHRHPPSITPAPARPITGEVDDAFWEESFTLNFMAARRLTELVIPAMKAERWGRIISISGTLVAPKLNAAARRRRRS